jgi:hypothetical protein
LAGALVSIRREALNPAVADAHPQRPNTLTIYGPVEEYWHSYEPGEARAIAPAPEPVLDPFTASLIHVVLGLVPDPPLLVDLAVGANGGAASLIGLHHPQVRRVVAVCDERSPETERALSALDAYLRNAGSGMTSFDVVPVDEMPNGLSGESHIVILADTSRGDIGTLEQAIRQWLMELPDALVLVLGVGRVGESAVMDSLLGICDAGSSRRFWSMRDCGEVLAASDAGMVARDDHPWAHEVIAGLRQRYTGEFPFLDLLRSVNQCALEAARIDERAIKDSPLSQALMAEMEALRRAALESASRANSAVEALAAANVELEGLRAALREARMREQPPALASVLISPSLLVRVRRRLAPTLLGKLWRRSKRIARRVLARRHL